MVNKISYIIHFRKDSEKRIQNLIAIRTLYAKLAPKIQFIIIEDDIKSNQELLSPHLLDHDKYKFIKNSDTYIRPHCFNIGSQMCDHNVIIAGDTDVFIHPDYLDKAATHIINDGISVMYPYNGLFVVVESELRKKIISDPSYDHVGQYIETLPRNINDSTGLLTIGHTDSKGGCVMFNKKDFFNFGGYNPNFKGWGYEDDEIYARARNLDYSIGRIASKDAIAWHLEHNDIDGDKKNISNPFYELNGEIAKNVRLMLKDDLIKYTNKWKSTYNWTEYTDAAQLLTPNRFDITAKILYGEFRDKQYNSSWGSEVYKNHLKVWNNFIEYTPNRTCYSDFENNFIEIFNSVKLSGFDINYPIPVTKCGEVLNGAHRIASCILTDTKLVTNVSQTPSKDGQVNCDSEYFRNNNTFVNGGLEEKYLDSMAYTYSKYKKNTFIITIFPSACGDLKQTEKEIQAKCKVVYKKHFKLNKKGALAFCRNAYYGEKWGGDWHNKFEGFQTKSTLCFKTDRPVITYLVESKIEDLKLLKDTIRNIHKISNHSVHINDTHEETIRLAQFAFNNNSIHFANNGNPTFYPSTQPLLDTYKKAVQYNENYCATSSVVMSMYGLRAAKDIDYFNNGDKIKQHYDISSHNGEIRNYTKSIHDIIYNPENHFWFEGVKYASLDTVRSMKLKRYENPKDVNDLKLFENV